MQHVLEHLCNNISFNVFLNNRIINYPSVRTRRNNVLASVAI